MAATFETVNWLGWQMTSEECVWDSVGAVYEIILNNLFTV